MSKNYIKNVAIVGAGGNSGKFMASALLETGKHTVTALTRPESTSQLPEGLQVKKVDYNNPASLVDALRGQDALIITLSVTTPQDQEAKLVQAAAEANVPWILPNQWSPDAASEELEKDLAMLWKPKIETRSLIERLGKSSWIAITTGFWYEWSLAIPFGYGFDFENRSVTFYGEGETPVSTSTWPQVGRAVASLFSLKVSPDGEAGASLEQFRNKHVYISSFTVSQKDMLDSVLRVTGDKREDWKIKKVPVGDLYVDAQEQMQKGDLKAFGKWLYARVFFPDGVGNHEKTRGLHNEVLGLPKEDLDHYTKIGVQRAKDVLKKGVTLGIPEVLT